MIGILISILMEEGTPGIERMAVDDVLDDNGNPAEPIPDEVPEPIPDNSTEATKEEAKGPLFEGISSYGSALLEFKTRPVK
jgi:hypothetical protein